MSGKILIFDGQPTNRIMLKVRLASACYDIQTASTVDETMQYAMARCPELVIVGAGVPAAEQAGICRALQANPETAPLPILVLCREEHRLTALRAGASAVLDAQGDELMLLARVRGLLRDANSEQLVTGFAEPRAEFEMARHAQRCDQPRIALIADRPARALAWKYALAQHLPFQMIVRDPEQALSDIADGRGAELYLISADIDQPGEGLRLLSELRSRAVSRNAAFVVAVPPERPDLAAIALDLGAGDTLPMLLAAPDRIETAVITLRSQLGRKKSGDLRRAAAQRSMTWAMTDPLTGLYNRRYALPRLIEAVGSAMREGTPLSLLAMDIDRFKLINDIHGHAAGDAALKETAARIERVVGQKALAARMGGEEFIAILPGVTIDNACCKAEMIRREIARAKINLPNRDRQEAVELTISIGVASLCEAEATLDAEMMAESLIDRADHAMLAAKGNGRNRVMRAHRYIAA